MKNNFFPIQYMDLLNKLIQLNNPLHLIPFKLIENHFLYRNFMAKSEYLVINGNNYN